MYIDNHDLNEVKFRSGATSQDGKQVYWTEI